MFGFHKETKPKGNAIKIKLSGMHCISCCLTIDATLEELPGILRSNTNYAGSESIIEYDPTKVSIDEIKAQILKLGYCVE